MKHVKSISLARIGHGPDLENAEGILNSIFDFVLELTDRKGKTSRG